MSIEELSLSELSEIHVSEEVAASNRAAPRVDRQIEIELRFPDRVDRYRTKDISYEGIFIEHPDPLPLRKLLRLRAFTDEGGAPLELLGVVANRVNSLDAEETGRAAGMGIQLFALGHDVKNSWRHFVRQEYDKDPEVREEVRRQEYPSLKVHFTDVDALERFIEDDVASGDVFVRSADLYQQGTRVWLETVHPATSEICAIEAIVMEYVESPRQKRGLRVMFPTSDEATETLRSFLNTET